MQYNNTETIMEVDGLAPGTTWKDHVPLQTGELSTSMFGGYAMPLGPFDPSPSGHVQPMKHSFWTPSPELGSGLGLG